MKLIIDTNLMVLFVVGSAAREYISMHKRLTAFSPDDFDLLLLAISKADKLLLTPNTLTETSNLLRYIAEPARTKICTYFAAIIEQIEEEYIPSNILQNQQTFLRLGLADTALVYQSASDIELLTTDLDLFLSVQAKGSRATNFNHLRDFGPN